MIPMINTKPRSEASDYLARIRNKLDAASKEWVSLHPDTGTGQAREAQEKEILIRNDHLSDFLRIDGAGLPLLNDKILSLSISYETGGFLLEHFDALDEDFCQTEFLILSSRNFLSEAGQEFLHMSQFTKLVNEFGAIVIASSLGLVGPMSRSYVPSPKEAYAVTIGIPHAQVKAASLDDALKPAIHAVENGCVGITDMMAFFRQPEAASC